MYSWFAILSLCSIQSHGRRKGGEYSLDIITLAHIACTHPLIQEISPYIPPHLSPTQSAQCDSLHAWALSPHPHNMQMWLAPYPTPT